MLDLTFTVAPCSESGGYVARWDDLHGGGITTQGDTIAELEEMLGDAVAGYFADRAERPSRLRLHFVEDPILAIR